MSVYVKSTAVITVVAIIVMVIGFRFSVEVSSNSVQKSLDARTYDAAKLIALALKDVDMDNDLDFVDSIVNGSFALGSFESVTLYDARGKMRIQKQKKVNTQMLSGGMLNLQAKEESADIRDNGGVSGKVVVKSDIRNAYSELEAKVESLMQLFIMLGAGSIILIAVIFKFIMRDF